MRKLLAIAVVLVALLAPAGGLAAGGGGNGGTSNGKGPVPPFPHLAGNWTHVEINVTIKKTPHTVILDRGRIIQLSSAQVTLRERDGTTVVIPLSGQTIVTEGLSNRLATLGALRKGQNAMVMRIDGGAAVRLRILPAA
jgi:hypothetical protein